MSRSTFIYSFDANFNLNNTFLYTDQKWPLIMRVNNVVILYILLLWGWLNTTNNCCLFSILPLSVKHLLFSLNSVQNNNCDSRHNVSWCISGSVPGLMGDDTFQATPHLSCWCAGPAITLPPWPLLLMTWPPCKLMDTEFPPPLQPGLSLSATLQ